jgi:hypothetical protein
MDLMRPPHPKESATPEAESLLVELSMALKAGRLVDLLERKDLPRNAVGDLPRLESAATLRRVFTEHLFATDAAHGPDPKHAPGRFPSKGGKLLVFKAREPSTL